MSLVLFICIACQILDFCDMYHTFQFPNPLTKCDLNIEPTGVSRGKPQLP